MSMDFRKLDRKWQKKWSKKRIFEANPGGGKKFFTSNVIPYVNGRAHVGHSYTFTRTDVYARFKRMQGFNTLLANGFHATGEPILGTIERLKKNDRTQIDTFRDFGATQKDIEDFKRKGPAYAATFWARKWEEDFRSMGYSIDWRRAFTLSITPQFSAFVEWQYNTLRKKGYVVQGTHPVVWCPHDQSPTGDHDRLEGEGESPTEYTLIKFPIGDAFLPAATLRPETVYGATNIWLNPHADYVKIEVNGEKWIVAKEAVIKARDQFKDVKEVREYDEKIDLFGRQARNPATGKDVPIFSSEFVDAGSATGVVMSVPSHAPYDYIALKESGHDIRLIDVVTSDLGPNPARSVCEEMKIISTKQTKELDEATNTVYKKEFHSGVLNENCGPYKGMKVSEVKERLISDFTKKGISGKFYDVAGVVCRCTTRCHVKILENQWFLKYSDEAWKERVKKCLAGMKIYPEEARNNFLATIDWMKDKACARKSGLGTKLPWDKEWLVETLSDSTVYMAYYTIAHIITKNKIKAAKLTDEVFDYVFLGKGNPKKVSKESGLRLSLLTSMKKEFDYFYPYDFRNSAKDLVQNHLTFFLYQHTALWNEDRWPRSVSVNGYVNVEGEKMSKSKGNIIPLKRLVEEHGADIVRINIAASSEGIDDADWRTESIKSYRQRIEFLHDLTKTLKKLKIRKPGLPETYLISRMNRIVKTATESYESAKFRTAVMHCLFEATNEVKWYLTRVEKEVDRKTLGEVLSIVIRLIAPLTPHVCEELWSMLGGKDFVSTDKWPEYDKSKINEQAEKTEAFVRQILEDVREIQKITHIKPKTAHLFLAEDWKFSVYGAVLKNKGKSSTEVTREIMSTDLKKYGSATVGFIQSLYKNLNELRPVLTKKAQINAISDVKPFLEKEIGCAIEVIDAEKSGSKKARSASPQKLGILLE